MTPAPASKKRKLDQTESGTSTSTPKTQTFNGNTKTDTDRICNKRKKRRSRLSQSATKKIAPDLSKLNKSVAAEDTLSASNVPSVTFSDIAGYQHVISVSVVVYIFVLLPSEVNQKFI